MGEDLTVEIRGTYERAEPSYGKDLHSDYEFGPLSEEVKTLRPGAAELCYLEC